MEEDYGIIYLHCIDCDKIKCSLAREYVSSESKEGCVRKCSERDKEKYYHYIEETLPFLKLYDNPHTLKEKYAEIFSFLDYFYDSSNIVKKIDKHGKVY